METKEIKIELTNQCYRNCIHCSSEAELSDNPKVLNKTTVKEVIDQAITLGVTSVVFTGGEATLYPDLEEVIIYAKKNNLKVKLYTMCHRIPEHVELLSQLEKAGLNEIIYSTTQVLAKDDYDEEKLLSFIKKINEVTNLKIGFHHVITNKTIDDIDSVFKIIDQIDKDKFTKIGFLRYVPHGRGDMSLLPTSKQLESFKMKIIQLMQHYPNQIKLGSPNNFLNINHTPCTAASKTMIVGFDGRVYPCDAMKYFDYLGFGGNIYEATLKEIYESDYFKDIRNFKFENGAECISCNNYQICKGGCLGTKMICSINGLNEITFSWYELNAKRTMNDFGSDELTKLNAKAGIAGETGELFDCIKKLFTHNISENYLQKLIDMMKKEIGDIIWYIAAPLATYYNFSMEDVANEIIKTNSENIKTIDHQLIKFCALSKDPMCPFNFESSGKPISLVDKIIDKNESFDLKEEWENIDEISFKLRRSQTKEEAIKYSALLIILLAKVTNLVLNETLENIIVLNIDKLRDLYPTGFSNQIASEKIASQEKYKETTDFKISKN